MRFLYLHGFASGPGSSKAAYFRQRLAAHGGDLSAPDLTPGGFESMTIRSELAALDAALGGEEAVLIGSSLGGYLAALAAASRPHIRRVLLLAPAFDFAARFAAHLGPEAVAQWQASGSLEVFHYGQKRNAGVGYELLADAQTHPAFPAVAQPALVLHGVRDDVVPASLSEEFVRRNPESTLRLYETGHEMIDVLDRLWEDSAGFLLGDLP